MNGRRLKEHVRYDYIMRNVNEKCHEQYNHVKHDYIMRNVNEKCHEQYNQVKHYVEVVHFVHFHTFRVFQNFGGTLWQVSWNHCEHESQCIIFPLFGPLQEQYTGTVTVDAIFCWFALRGAPVSFNGKDVID